LFDKHLSRIKHHLRNGLIDGASIAIVLGISFTAIGGFTILYSSFYNTGSAPTPADFQAAGYQFTSAISLIYMLRLTRQHRKEEAAAESKLDTKSSSQS
jgi:hypothetical protein